MKIKTGLPDKERKTIAEGLSRVLADSFTLYLKTHAFLAVLRAVLARQALADAPALQLVVRYSPSPSARSSCARSSCNVHGTPLSQTFAAFSPAP